MYGQLTFFTGTLMQFNFFFKKNCVKPLNVYMQIHGQLRHKPHISEKTFYLKWITDINIKCKAIKLLEVKLGDIFITYV